MWDKLERVEQRYHELGELLSSPEVIGDRSLLGKYSKEHSELTPVVEALVEYRKLTQELADSKELLEMEEQDSMREMISSEIKELQEKLSELEPRLKILLLPKDPNDSKNVVLEIRAGAGGDEAGIFAGDLFRMYTRYGENRGWRIEALGMSEATQGGYKEIIAMIYGDGAYSQLKHESGVHRVQRVPATESQGRIHTSTVTVAVLPEAEDVEVHIDDKDLRIDVYRASGPGGQSVNTTDSAVRITHLPTGIVVAMQDEKSQIKNKAKAMRVLKARVLQKEEEEKAAERAADRKSQVGTGDRSERIRTYNFPQSRLTDHRINLTLYSLDEVIEGDVDQVIQPLITHYQTIALQGDSDDLL
jgi:peptide chain release factor 1